ncbi:MAG TPA: phosphotransferase [Candidatus Acidoferrales bacterium]|nr:phosphotransferase [Candidatus Acidoferrales bacterium]
MEYSKQLGAITDAQFQAALTHFGLGMFVRATPIPFGLFGQNVFLTSTAGEFVLRGSPLLPWQFPTERYFARALHERTTAPAPWPYLVDESPAIFGWSYALMPRMRGVNADDPAIKARLTRDDRMAMARAMAQNLAEMQRLTAQFAGRIDPASETVKPFVLAEELAWPFPFFADPTDSPILSHAERVEVVIRNLLQRARATNNRTTLADIEWVERVLETAHDAMRVEFTPCFVMEDYKEGNVVFDDSSGRWSVSGVFDLMESYFGDGESDLSRTVATYLDEDPDLAREFIRGYLALRPPRDGFAERFAAYMMLERLIIWEYVQRNEPKVAVLGSLRNWAEKYVDAWPALSR